MEDGSILNVMILDSVSDMFAQCVRQLILRVMCRNIIIRALWSLPGPQLRPSELPPRHHRSTAAPQHHQLHDLPPIISKPSSIPLKSHTRCWPNPSPAAPTPSVQPPLSSAQAPDNRLPCSFVEASRAVPSVWRHRQMRYQ